MAPFFGPGGVGVSVTPITQADEALAWSAWTLPSEHSRGDVPQRTVWSLFVVSPPVLLQQHRCFLQAAEQLAVEQFVPQPAVERLAVRILPRASRLDVQRLGPLL